MNKKKMLGIWLLLLGMMVISVFSVSAASNPKSVNLRVGSNRKNVYKSYDITGDHQPDQINIAVGYGNKIDKKDSNGYYNNIFVSINDKTQILETGYFYSARAKLYTLSNGKPYLFLETLSDNDYHEISGLFSYNRSKKKIETAIDFTSLFNGYAGRSAGTIVKMSGNKITVRYGMMSYSLGGCSIDYNYTYKNDKLVRTSYYGKLISISKRQGKPNVLIAKRKLVAYTVPGTKKKAFTIKKGGSVKIMQVWKKTTSLYIKVKYESKYGWIKAAGINTSQQFSNVVYAG
ncbi:hypothetical protein ACTQ50_10360 [Blautia sp. Sow4_E7]|uniref:hypothetical protein n=1 Tax=Blautia sp. Sow4_E7 TaxID=3438749 RepID=UPI003F9256AA